MFERYKINQIKLDRHVDLKEKIDHYGLDIKTMSKVFEEARENSFFNSLTSPSFEIFVDRKTKGKKFSFSEFKQKEFELKTRFECIGDFKSKKISKHISIAIKNAKDEAMNLLSRTDKIVMEMFKDEYASSDNRHYFGDPTYYWTLDDIINFYIDYTKIGFSDSMVIQRASNIIDNRLDPDIKTWKTTEHLSLFSLYRVFATHAKNLNENFIETVYNLQYSLDMLRLVIKRNPALSSFINNEKLLVDLVRYDKKHYSQFSFGREYSSTLKLNKIQVIQFTKFYLTTTDKRLNCENVINELCLHLKKYNERELIEELVLNHHRAYSSVIAGKITMDSYSSHTKSFLRYILSENGYDKFCKLVERDDKESYDNAIKLCMKDG